MRAPVAAKLAAHAKRTRSAPLGKPVSLDLKGASSSKPRGRTVGATPGDASSDLEGLGHALSAARPRGSEASASGSRGPCATEATVFFRSTRGRVVHIQAPGAGWAPLCSVKTARAGVLFGDVIVLGNFEAAKTQDKRFCSTCLGRAGLVL